MRLAILTLAAAAALSTAAIAAKTESLATPAPPPGTGLASGECLRNHDIRGHKIVDGRTLLIATTGQKTYRVTMSGTCLSGAMVSDHLVTRNAPASDLICKPLDLDIAISRSGFETPCIVESIVRLTPEEVAALPAKLKP